MVLMDNPMGLEGSSRTFVVNATVSEAAKLAQKPEGRQQSEPGKPLRRIGHQREFTLPRTDHHVVASGPIFNQRKQGAPPAFRQVGMVPPLVERTTAFAEMLVSREATAPSAAQVQKALPVDDPGGIAAPETAQR